MTASDAKLDSRSSASPPRQLQNIGSEAAACDDGGDVIDDAARLIGRLSRQDFLRLGEEARADRIEAATHLASVLDEPFDKGRACRAVRWCQSFAHHTRKIRNRRMAVQLGNDLSEGDADEPTFRTRPRAIA